MIFVVLKVSGKVSVSAHAVNDITTTTRMRVFFICLLHSFTFLIDIYNGTEFQAIQNTLDHVVLVWHVAIRATECFRATLRSGPSDG